jgi:hypothetical protein
LTAPKLLELFKKEINAVHSTQTVPMILGSRDFQTSIAVLYDEVRQIPRNPSFDDDVKLARICTLLNWSKGAVGRRRGSGH